MQESPHVLAEFDEASRGSFRGLTALLGLVALTYLAARLLDPLSSILKGPPIPVMSWILSVTTTAGWGGLVYACWIRSGRITDTALAFVLVLGFSGMAISLLLIAGEPYAPHPGVFTMAIVVLTGTWIMNGLGIAWIVQKVRRIMAASNTDTSDAPR